MRLVLTILLLSTLSASAQSTISGILQDKKGNPIAFANVFIENSYDGATTDINGAYQFTTNEKGNHILVASFIGFKTQKKHIQIQSSDLNADFILAIDFNQIDAVTVTAGSFEASDEKKSVTLKPMDIVTTAGGAADIYETMKLLPGTSTVGEQEGLFVRGGSASETVTIIDEMVVQNPYYSSVPDVPQRSRFQPFLFKGTMFSTGGYSAVYGKALSSALILNSMDMADSSQTGLGIHMAGVNLFHAHRYNNGSVSLGGEYNELTPYFNLVKQQTDWVKAPEALNSEFVFRQKLGKNDMLKVYALASRSSLKLNYYNVSNDSLFISSFENKNQNLFVNASYKKAFADKWFLFTGFSVSDNKDDITDNNITINQNKQLWQGKLIGTRYFKNDYNFKFGGEYHYQTNDGSFGIYDSEFTDNYSAVFAEANIKFGSRLAAHAGIRAEQSTLLNDKSLAPRLSLAYKTGVNSQISVAYGTFYQAAEDSILLKQNKLGFEKSAHYLSNYQWNSDSRVFRIEAYYKHYDNLVSNHKNIPYTYTNSGNGYAQGIDVFWRDEKTFNNTDYWISYSFIDSKRLYRDMPEKASPNFISDHNLSVVYKYTFQKIMTTVGGSYAWATGRKFMIPSSNDLYRYDETPQYHNLSLSASKLTSIFGQFTVIYAAVYNVLDRENIFAYKYSPNGQNRIETGAPSLRSIFVGCFISIQ